MIATAALLKVEITKTVAELDKLVDEAWSEVYSACQVYERAVITDCDVSVINTAVRMLDKRAEVTYSLDHHGCHPPMVVDTYQYLRVDVHGSSDLDIRRFHRHFRLKPTKLLRDLLRVWREADTRHQMLVKRRAELLKMDIESAAVIIESTYRDPAAHADLVTLVRERVGGCS